MDNEYQQLLNMYQREKAIHDCENIIGRLTYYMTAFLGEKIMTLWAERDDCSLEMPFAGYDGREGVKRFFLDVMGDRNNPEVYEKIRGVMCFTTLDAQVLEVAGDRMTARGTWYGPGCETYGKSAIYEEFRGTGFWSWQKTAADFIFENGEWRLWHLKFHQIFRSEYFTPWTQMPDYKGWVLGPAKGDYIPQYLYKAYDSECPQWDNIPVPMPYHTFTDVAPGYGRDVMRKEMGK